MTENKTVISLYLQSTLDIINADDIEFEGESLRNDTKEEIIRYVANRNQINLLPYSVNEMVLDTGLLEAYEFGSLVPGGYNSPLIVDNLPTDTQKITLDFQNVKYLVERFGKDETNEKWLTSINDWVEAVSDFQYANKNTGEVFNEYINRLSSIFVRKVLSILALKYGVIPFDKDVIEIIKWINKMHTNLINMKKLKRSLTREERMEKYKGGLAEMLPTFTSPPIDESLITWAGGLFPRGDYQATDASIITKSLYHLLVAKTIEFSDGEFKRATKDFSVGTIFISMDVTEDTRKRIIAKGQMVYKVLHTMIGYWLNTPPNEGYRLKVSGAEILEHLGQLYPHDSKGSRLTKEISLNELAGAIILIKNLRISTTLIESRTKTKYSWRLQNSALFDISYQLKGQGNVLDPDDVNPVTDIELTYVAGEWFKYLHTQDRKYYNCIGYVHKDALSSNDYYGKLLLWLTNELGYHQSVNYKIRNILSDTGYHALVESLQADYDKDKALTLFKTFSIALEKIKAMDNAYSYDYRNPPTWLRLGCRKPRGWCPEWLDVVIVFEKPVCLEKIKLEEVAKHKVIDIKAEKVEDTSPPNDLEDLEARIKESGVSKRAISLYLNESNNWLSRKLTRGNWTKKDFKEIYDAISFLSKKK